MAVSEEVGKVATGAIDVLRVAFVMWMLASPAQADPPRPCVDPQIKEHIRQLTKQGIDNAMMHHVEQLFTFWLKDDTRQPTRAQVGMSNGIEAYKRAQADAARWDPPVCKEEPFS